MNSNFGPWNGKRPLCQLSHNRCTCYNLFDINSRVCVKSIAKMGHVEWRTRLWWGNMKCRIQQNDINEWINEAGLSWSGLGLFSTWQVKPIRWLWAATSKHSLKKKLKSNRDKMFASFWWKGSWKEIFHWPRLVLSTCYGSYGGHYSSVDSSVPSTLWSRVQIPSATATLFPL